jgi:nucleoside-triphosphatase
VALLLTGRPGIGKTTVLRAAAQKLADFDLAGFYTEEIRVGSERRGFRLVTFAGEEAIIAHIDLPPPRVSKYGVDVAAISRFAGTLRAAHDRSAIYLVDEIGKMECLSAAFVDAMRGLLDGGHRVVATIAQRGAGRLEGPEAFFESSFSQGLQDVRPPEAGKTNTVTSEAERTRTSSLVRGAASLGFIDEVKRRDDVELWTVTQATRDAMPDQIVGWIQAASRRN